MKRGFSDQNFNPPLIFKASRGALILRSWPQWTNEKNMPLTQQLRPRAT